MSFQMLRDASLEFLEAEIPQLRIESWSNAARTLEIRGFCETNLISYDHTTNADRSRAADTFSIASVPLSLQVSPATAPVRRGECYVRITLLMGGFPVGRLISAYLTDGKTLTWPPGVHEGFTKNPGLIRFITGTNPAAGSEISETVPTNAVWRILNIRLVLTTDGTAANREVALELDDGTTKFQRISSGTVQGASLIKAYSAVAGIGVGGTYYSEIIPLGSRLKLDQGYRIRTNTANLQAGDDFSAPIFVVEEWIQE